MKTPEQLTITQLGWKYIVWGLGLFITGFLTGFIPILHYIPGAQAGNVGPAFLKNVTLWWGCPAVLAELTLKTGSLGMMAIGFAYLAIRQQNPADLTSRERIAPTLCSYGLIAELVTAAVFYVVCNLIWPNFYFEPVQAGKNLWLAVQGISIAFFVVGVIFSFSSIRNRSATLVSAVVR
jgi:hypothetical protein